MERVPFRIGLCLAGAVSAGAYTAGVIDYLMEALQEWQRRKDANEPNTPRHDVQLAVVGGASAGGMTGIILASAINQPYTPLQLHATRLKHRQPQHVLYHSWVDLVQDDMFPVLLNTGDIRKKEIYSLLNSGFIDTIAERVTQPVQSPVPTPAFIDPNLKLFVTLSNLKGFTYNAAFRSATATSPYMMSIHNDYACFELNAPRYQGRGWTPLDFSKSVNVSLARQAAMATGAFPVGLRAREVMRELQHVKDNRWLSHYLAQANMLPDPISSINVDGGMINNEPFEKVQDVLRDVTGDTATSTYNDFRGCVLMVDPFPSTEQKFNPAPSISTVVGNTLSALLAQNRAKPLDVQQAWDSHNPAQFLIAPVRDNPFDRNKRLQGADAIACGSLGGFGGFLNKDFRIHDFFLGRANAERFLRHYFTVPASTANPIFTDGYAAVNDRVPFTSGVDKGLQIIPVFSKEQNHMPLPEFAPGVDWPALEEATLNNWKGLIRKRAQALLMNFDDYRWDTRLLLQIGAWVVINRKIADTVITVIKNTLKKHQLMK